eukprot:754576-Hanusia_phi.AAC.4
MPPSSDSVIPWGHSGCRITKGTVRWRIPGPLGVPPTAPRVARRRAPNGVRHGVTAVPAGRRAGGPGGTLKF